MRSSITPSQIKDIDISHRLSDKLIQYFYLLGIEPKILDISEFTKEKNYLKPNFKNVELLTKYPPFEQKISGINTNTILNHCFPNGFSLIESDEKPKDEFFHFNLDNLYSLWPENKKLYFVCVIIYEPIREYLNIKYENNIPEIKQNGLTKEENTKDVISIDKIYVPKALCFSSFVSFPHELKILMNELIKYIRSNKITLPIEKVLETIVFGIPRPLKAYFNISCNKNKLIPGQSKDIDFFLREFNQYDFSSYPFQSIFKFAPNTILSIYKGLLLEIPILFFSSNKELLTNVIESFLSLLYPLEYQYPHTSILPDTSAGLIEIEKCFVFGINQKLEIITKEINNRKYQYPSYFKKYNLNISNRAFMLCDIDSGKANAYIQELEMYHVIDFENLGIYDNTNNNNVIDPTQFTSKDIYTGKLTDITEDTLLPEKYTEKLKIKLDEYVKDNKKLQSEDYSLNNNKKIGDGFFYYYLASILLFINNYLYNTEDEIKKICKEILTKKEDEINIENLVNITQFLYDYNNDNLFYGKFVKTKMFKNFVIRKYLNGPLERYVFLNFDEKIFEKRQKKFYYLKKKKPEFTNSTLFQSTHTYTVLPPTNFNEVEIKFIKENKDILLKEYYQKIDENNKINYILFPKLIYDNTFFKNNYKPSINFSDNNNLINCLKGYQAAEDTLKSDKFLDFCTIYKGDLVNKYIININELEYHNEVINSLYLVWIIVFCMTFYYCNEIEKHFRFEELMRFLPKIIDRDEKIISIVLLAIKKYGDEDMIIKIFELIKNFNYAEYACLCSKFKSDVQINWDIKNIDVANSKLKISYYRDPKADDKKLSEIKTVDYDIKSLKKRTFFINENDNIFSDSEKISFDLTYKCQNCEEEFLINSLVVNLDSKMKKSFMKCSKCNKIIEPISHVVLGMKKEEFKIYSPMKLLEIAKDIMKENGVRIDMDDLRKKYNTFFWNCIMYFKFNNLNFEILLKYKDKESGLLPKDKISLKRKRRGFTILECEKQNNEI